MPSSMHVTSASPLPRVEMATVKGLNSQMATPAVCHRADATWVLPPCRHLAASRRVNILWQAVDKR